MPRAVSMVRQATATAAAFVGAVAQLIVDTGLNVIRVHDGVTPGGSPQLGANLNFSDVPNKALARTNLGCLSITSNLSDLGNTATARSNLGLGNVSVLSTGTGNGSVPVFSNAPVDNRIVACSGTAGNIAASSINLSDVSLLSANLAGLNSASAARGNLGLGNAAVKSVSNNSLGVVASVSAATIARLAAYSDNNGTIGDSGVATANVAQLSVGGTQVFTTGNVFSGVNALRMDGGDASSHPVVFLDGTQSGANAGRIKYSTSGPSGTLDDGEIWLVYI